MNDGFDSLGRVRLQAIVLLAIAFFAGWVGGLATGRVFGESRGAFWLRREEPVRVSVERGAASSLPTAGSYLERAVEAPMRLPSEYAELDLTDPQRERIERILASGRPAADSILRSAMPPLRALTARINEQIESVLTPAQKERLDASRHARFSSLLDGRRSGDFRDIQFRATGCRRAGVAVTCSVSFTNIGSARQVTIIDVRAAAEGFGGPRRASSIVIDPATLGRCDAPRQNSKGWGTDCHDLASKQTLKMVAAFTALPTKTKRMTLFVSVLVRDAGGAWADGLPRVEVSID